MRRFALLALLLPLATYGADYAPDPANATLGFAGTAQGEGFEGRFRTFTAEIRFDPAALADSRFDVRIDLASADSANEERDSTLKGEEFFDVASAAQAHYLATRFRALPDGRFAADGELTLRGVTRPVVLTFAWTPGSPAVLDGEAMLKRLDFNVGGGDWADEETLANGVRVFTRLSLRPR